MKTQCQWMKTLLLNENTMSMNKNTITEWKHCHWMKTLLLNENDVIEWNQSLNKDTFSFSNSVFIHWHCVFIQLQCFHSLTLCFHSLTLCFHSVTVFSFIDIVFSFIGETSHWIKTLLLNEDHAIKKTQCQCMRMLLLNENSVYEWKHLHSTKIILHVYYRFVKIIEMGKCGSKAKKMDANDVPCKLILCKWYYFCWM
jgi:hypothetical protein